MESIFANRFKRFRKSLDLTQVELAKVAGLSQANITAWESGKKGTKPSRESLIKLQKAFDWLDIDWLFDGVGQMKIEKQVIAEEPHVEYKAMTKE